MAFQFSSNETQNGYLALPACQMDGMSLPSMDNGVRGLGLDNPFCNVAEFMNFEQMFPTSAFSPITAELTNISSFDGLNCINQYNLESPMVDSYIVKSSSITGEQEIFHHMDSQLPFPINYADDGLDLIEMRDEKSSHHSVIPSSPMQSLAEKMLRALHLFREQSGGGILAQVWVPVKNGDHYILSTSEQPYLLDQFLSGYREVSRSFTFATESKPGHFRGLPGRVFNSKVPEWTSNVIYYNKAEYLRVQYALQYEVRGSIALPIFEDDLPERCCAVLELVTVKEKSNFDLEMEKVCSALQAVKLRSSTAPQKLYSQSLSKNQRAALAEIKDVLRATCHAHQLPLALTWIPCSPNEKCVLSVEVSACYVNDRNMENFMHACAEHYLEEGQGIVGKALQSNQPFFYPDVKQYHINEHPVVHHARKFGLNAAVAIRLRSTYTVDNDYVIEFFLPVSMKGSVEQQLLLNNLSRTMQRMCKSLRTVSEAELLGVEKFEVEVRNGIAKSTRPVAWSRSFEKSLVNGDFNSLDHVRRNACESTTTGMEDDGPCVQALIRSRKQMEKKRRTAEKHVGLNVLQQYFSRSLKDAAKRIGVCPTALKRICRQHGIKRWPSRKINKVDRSLRKIQSVLDSVQGVEGDLLQFDSTNQEFDTRKSAALPNNTCIRLVDDSSMIPEASGSHFVSGISSSMVTDDEDILHDNGIVEHNHSTSSGTTNSSNGSGSGSGSMMNGISVSKITVKATYNEDTIRFKFEPASGSFQLYEKVAKRLDLQIGHFQLKYLDDEEEWVLLVNDSDLRECLEIMEFLGNRNVKFLVCDVSISVGSSGSSNCFMGGSF